MSWPASRPWLSARAFLPPRLRRHRLRAADTWRAPDGHVTNLSYQMFTDRANADLGLVALTLTPQWTGTARVIDSIDPPPPATVNKVPTTLTTQVTKGWDAAAGRDWLSVQTLGTGITAALAPGPRD
jgi:Glycosyl hydrolase family 65, N-terminal domain